MCHKFSCRSSFQVPFTPVQFEWARELSNGVERRGVWRVSRVITGGTVGVVTGSISNDVEAKTAITCVSTDSHTLIHLSRSK